MFEKILPDHAGIVAHGRLQTVAIRQGKPLAARRAGIEGDWRLHERRSSWRPHAGIKLLCLPVERFLFDKGEQLHPPTGANKPVRRHRHGAEIPRWAAGGREAPLATLVVLDCQPDLLEIVLALHPPARLARLLDRGDAQVDQERDDRDHQEKLNERQPHGMPPTRHTRASLNNHHSSDSRTAAASGAVPPQCRAITFSAGLSCGVWPVG